jgi:hypothetical protein
MTADAGVDAQIEWALTVQRDGKGVPDAREIVAFESGGQPVPAGLSVTLPAGESLTAAVPPAPQTWLRSAFRMGFRPVDGDYTLRLCATPRIERAAKDSYETVVDCPECARGSFEVADGRLCVPVPVRIQGLPFSWWSIAAATLFTILVLLLCWRWITRPRFRRGLKVGVLHGYSDLRGAQSHGAAGKLATFFRKPGYLQLRPDGTTIYFRKPLVDPQHAQSVILGIRPNPVAANQDLLLWCAAVPTPEDGREVSVYCGEQLAPRGAHLKLFADGTVHIPYDELAPPGRPIEVRTTVQGVDATIERYPIYLDQQGV